MPPLVTPVLSALGVLLLPLAIFSLYQNVRAARVSVPGRQPRLWTWGWGLATLLGLASFFVWYPVRASDGRTWNVQGIPFPAYAFGAGVDYAGAVTIPILLLDGFIWALAPQILLFMLWRRRWR